MNRKVKRHNNSNQRTEIKQYIRSINPYGWNDVMCAIEMNNPMSAIEHIKHCNINITNNLGWTPLFLAVNKHNCVIVQKLLEYGADVNKTLVSGTTCLHEAARLHNIKIVQLLLKYGANPCALNRFKRYPVSHSKYININKLLFTARITYKLNYVLFSKLLIIQYNIPKDVIFIILSYLTE